MGRRHRSTLRSVRALQVIGLILFGVVACTIAVVELKRVVDHRAGRRFRCPAGLVDLRSRALPRFVRLGLVRCDLTSSRLQVALVLEFGHRSRSSLIIPRHATQLIRLDPIDASASDRRVAFGVSPEVLGRVVLTDGSTKSMSFIISADDASGLRQAGDALGWTIEMGAERLASPLSAPLDSFPGVGQER